MESQKVETSRFASNDSSDLSAANRRSSGFLRDRQNQGEGFYAQFSVPSGIVYAFYPIRHCIYELAYKASGSMRMAPLGHTKAQMPHPLQKA